MDKLQGLLSNPALQMGLGILASNNTDNFGQAIGRGGLLGLRNLQQQQIVGQRQQQMEMMAKMREAQAKELERRAAQAQQQAQAGSAFKEQFPQYASVYDISPAQALKLAYPQSSGSSTPYFQAVPTPQGIGRFNARTGEMELITSPQGKPFVKSSDSPALQGKIAEEKARGAGKYKINTDLPSVVTTDTNIVDKINAPQGGWQIPNDVQKQRDDERLSILMSEQQAVGGAGVNPALDQEIANVQKKTGVQGIAVPTKAEEAAEVERAKLGVKDEDANKGRVDSLDAVTEAKKLLEDGIYTGALASMKLKASKLNPFDDPTKAANTEAFIAAIGNTVVPRLQEFGGNDSVEEMNYLKAIMGGNIELEPEALRMVLDSSERKITRGMKRAGIDVDAMRQELGAEQQGASDVVGNGDFSVKAPNGKTYRFNTQSELNNFKMKAKIR